MNVKDSLNNDINVGDEVTWASKNRYSGSTRISKGKVEKILTDEKGTRIGVRYTNQKGQPRFATIFNFSKNVINLSASNNVYSQTI